MRYVVAGFFSPDIELEVPGEHPPCMKCGQPVTARSCDGPLVCAPCDMGKRPDGTQLTAKDYRQQTEHRRAYIERYRVTPEPS